MNKKYDDDFFDELDKTTDLLKAFKPHIENNSMDSLESLYSEFNINKNKENKIEEKKQEQKDNFTDYLNSRKQESVVSCNTKCSSENNSIQSFSTSKSSEYMKQENFKEYKQVNVSKEEQSTSNKKIISFDSFDDDFDLQYEEEKTNISEILDKMNVDSSKKKQTIEIKKEDIKDKKKKEKKSKAKFNFFEVAFITLSFIFIVSCIFLYGSKLMNKEEVKKPKLTLLSTSLTKSSNITTEGDGLYKVGEDYIYKGQDVDNYVSYSNMLWRIIKKNSDGTVDMITEEYMHTLSWNGAVTSYIETDIHTYLNNDFVSVLDKAYLAKVDICLDDVDNVNVINCTNKNSDYYVRLLTVEEYLNSKLEYTYVAPLTDTLWLGNKSYSKVWQVSGNDVALNVPTKPLGIKPVVKLHKKVAIISGDGTKENPYTLGL